MQGGANVEHIFSCARTVRPYADAHPYAGSVWSAPTLARRPRPPPPATTGQLLPSSAVPGKRVTNTMAMVAGTDTGQRKADMTDLDVVAVLVAKPGSEALMYDALAGLVEPTLAEDGCISYQLFTSAVDPNTFITIEKWRSQDDVDQHMQTPHIQQALRAAGDHFAVAPAIHPLQPGS